MPIAGFERLFSAPGSMKTVRYQRLGSLSVMAARRKKTIIEHADLLPLFVEAHQVRCTLG